MAGLVCSQALAAQVVTAGVGVLNLSRYVWVYIYIYGYVFIYLYGYIYILFFLHVLNIYIYMGTYLQSIFVDVL